MIKFLKFAWNVSKYQVLTAGKPSFFPGPDRKPEPGQRKTEFSQNRHHYICRTENNNLILSVGRQQIFSWNGNLNRK
jgi:hypothetical protein